VLPGVVVFRIGTETLAVLLAPGSGKTGGGGGGGRPAGAGGEGGGPRCAGAFTGSRIAHEIEKMRAAPTSAPNRISFLRSSFSRAPRVRSARVLVMETFK